MNKQTKNRIREQWDNKLRNKWETFSVVNDYYENADIRLNSDSIADWWLSKIDELLKEQKVEHCDNEDCPECQTKLLDKYKAELIEKVEKYKTYYNPIGDNINKGRTLACDDILLLIKSK